MEIGECLQELFKLKDDLSGDITIHHKLAVSIELAKEEIFFEKLARDKIHRHEAEKALVALRLLLEDLKNDEVAKARADLKELIRYVARMKATVNLKRRQAE